MRIALIVAIGLISVGCTTPKLSVSALALKKQDLANNAQMYRRAPASSSSAVGSGQNNAVDSLMAIADSLRGKNNVSLIGISNLGDLCEVSLIPGYIGYTFYSGAGAYSNTLSISNQWEPLKAAQVIDYSLSSNGEEGRIKLKIPHNQTNSQDAVFETVQISFNAVLYFKGVFITEVPGQKFECKLLKSIVNKTKNPNLLYSGVVE